MLPLLDYIKNKNSQGNDLFIKTFEKYLVISCVSLLEKYITLEIRRDIEEQEINISSFKLRTPHEKMQIKYPDITMGECVVIQSDFTNPNVINDISNHVLKQDEQFRSLNMDFFDAVKKIDWYDPYKIR
jgi:hypothetical protein